MKICIYIYIYVCMYYIYIYYIERDMYACITHRVQKLRSNA